LINHDDEFLAVPEFQDSESEKPIDRKKRDADEENGGYINYL
jgi:hypothetical protein